jgi:hypothetical protein
MKLLVAEIPLTPQELGSMLAAHASAYTLTAAHVWDSYALEIRIHDGRLVGAVLRFHLEEGKLQQVEDELGVKPVLAEQPPLLIQPKPAFTPPREPKLQEALDLVRRPDRRGDS